MKKVMILLITILFIFTFTFYGCGDTKVIDGIEYDTYGLLNKESKQNPNIEYELIIGNVVWSILLGETIVAPIYFCGFSLFEPIGKKQEDFIKGAIKGGIVK